MTTDWLLRFLIWCTLINYAVLIVWFLAFANARELLHRLHGRWFRIPADSFDAVHYGGMAAYKIGILLFNLAPLLALCLTSKPG